MNYHHLFYFWSVVSEGGFAKAATKLRISQSAISLQVAKLEEFLGEKLMERGPKGFTLTEAGHVAFSQADEILNRGRALVQHFRTGQTHSILRVGAIGGLSKNLQVKLLSKALEDSSLELSLEVGDSESLLNRLVNFKLDGIFSDAPYPSSESEPLNQIEVANEPVCLVAKKSSSKRARDLETQIRSGIFLPGKSSPVTSGILTALKAQHDQFTVRGYIDDIALLRLFAFESDALIAIPKVGVQRDLEAGSLVVVQEFKKVRQSYYLVTRRKGQPHPLISKLVRA